MAVNRTKYDLPGGSLVEVHKVFGDEYYIAIVDMKGRYPEEGSIAKDKNREEYIVLIEGEMNITHNGELKTLKPSDHVLIQDGDTYLIEGEGKAIVFVKDSEGGTSEIIPE